MVLKTVTSVSRMNPPRINQTGPFMRNSAIYKHELIVELPPNVSTSPVVEDRLVTLTYSDGGTLHQATLSQDAGCLRCCYCTLNDKVVWCPHLHYAIRYRHDTALYAGALAETLQVTVPLIPSEGVFLPVDFSPIGDTGFVRASVSFTQPDERDEEIIEAGVLRAGAFGTAEVRNMVIDMFQGRASDPNLFHQDVPRPRANTQFGRAAAEKERALSEFSRRYYQAIWGKTFGEMEVTSGAKEDAPDW